MDNSPLIDPHTDKSARIPWLTGIGMICGTLGMPAFLLGGILFATSHVADKRGMLAVTLIPSALAAVFGMLGRRREPAQRGLASIGIILGGVFLLLGASLLYLGGGLFPDL